MKMVDANILLYAVNRDAPHHVRARSWWEEALGGDETIGLAWTVLLAFLRIATLPAAFRSPLTPRQAMDEVTAWLAHPNTQLVAETERHWDILRALLPEAQTSGNLVPDAHLASIALGHAACLASCDSDFARFPGLRWENPLA